MNIKNMRYKDCEEQSVCLHTSFSFPIEKLTEEVSELLSAMIHCMRQNRGVMGYEMAKNKFV